MIFKGYLCVKNQAKEFGFFYYFGRLLSQKDVHILEKSIPLVQVDAHCLWSGELKTILTHPILNAVKAQMHSPFHTVQPLALHALNKIIHKQGTLKECLDRKLWVNIGR